MLSERDLKHHSAALSHMSSFANSTLVTHLQNSIKISFHKITPGKFQTKQWTLGNVYQYLHTTQFVLISPNRNVSSMLDYSLLTINMKKFTRGGLREVFLAAFRGNRAVFLWAYCRLEGWCVTGTGPGVPRDAMKPRCERKHALPWQWYPLSV